jgi:hypothetical protein
MTYVELEVHVVLPNCFPLTLRPFKCIGCQNGYRHVKNIGVHQFTHIHFFEDFQGIN